MTMSASHATESISACDCCCRKSVFCFNCLLAAAAASLNCLVETAGTETDEEVERAFQQSVQVTSNPAPASTSMQLTAAVHDMDIDHLLQKLICGEIEYNPHDPNRCTAYREGWVCLDGMQHKA